MRTKRQKKGLQLIAFILLATFSALTLAGCGKSNVATEVWGRAEAKEVDVNSKIPGRVLTILVKEGDKVEKGQLLAHIDNRDIQAKAEQAKAGVQAVSAQLSQATTVTSLQDQTSQAAVNNAEAQLNKAAADLALSENDYKRFSELAATGAVSKQALEAYHTKYQVAQASFAQAQSALAAAQAGLMQSAVNKDNEAAMKSKLSQAQAALAETEVYLNETEIRAPFAGVVTVKYVEEGAMLSTGMPIVAIQDPTDNWVNIKVKETELASYKLGQNIQLEGRDGKLKIDGKIVHINKKPEFATYRSTSERGDTDIITYNVKIQVNSDQINPGMRFRLVGGGQK